MTLPIKANRQSHEDKPPAGREDSVNEFSFDDDASSFDIRDKDISPTPDRLPTEPEYAHRLESEPVPAGRNPFSRPLPRPIVHTNPLDKDKPSEAHHDDDIPNTPPPDGVSGAASLEHPSPAPSNDEEERYDFRSWLSHPFTSYYLILLPIIMLVITGLGVSLARGVSLTIGVIIMAIVLVITPIISLIAAFHMRKGAALRILMRILAVLNMVACSIVVIILLVGTLITGTITKNILNESENSLSSQTTISQTSTRER